MQTSDRNGALVGAIQVFDGDELMLISMRTFARTSMTKSLCWGVTLKACA